MVFAALAAEFGPFSELATLEASRVAALRVSLETSIRALDEARHRRETGRGRRPSRQEAERLARRAGKDDASYQSALDRLRELATKAATRPVSGIELLQRAAAISPRRGDADPPRAHVE
jgi:hypothetical protein